MGFDSILMPSRKRKQNRRRSSRKLNARLGAARSGGGYRVAVVVLVLLVLATAGVVSWLVVRLVGGALFSQNDRFAIERIEVQAGKVISRDLVKEYLQVEKGMNLFALDIKELRRDFMRRAPNVKELEIRRRLPDTLEIDVVERLPLARLGVRGNLVVDREGMIFAVGTIPRDMPYITGYPEHGVRPGTVVSGMAVAALQVLDVCDNPRLGIRVDGIDVSRDDYLLLRLPGQKPGKFLWEGMGERTLDARRNLIRRLSNLAQVYRSDRGRLHNGFDATYADSNMIIGQ